jgi:type IV secretory pathway TrbF-like protein
MLTAPPEKTFNQAKQQFMEHYGSALVTNTYLKIALAGMTAVSLGLVVLNMKTVQKYQNVKPLVIRISDLGRVEALNYSHFE